GVIDQHKIDLVARAGGSYYTRARDGFFEIDKPISTLGIGVDQIPIEIRNSTILTGNNLGMLGNVEQLPSDETVNNFAKEHPQFIGLETTKKHTFAQDFLSKNDVESAWKVLLLK
ncbi:MAG: flavin reductase family protein, partial [Flavobacteriales bacterium]